ncbi:hypothetical protein CK203_038015 [Vitis vinifera]|uniref:Uncharacterized protein n=1 Tax=Vitis vinifera TaxID=29760 RepID=A0A438HNW7_VITVI|nr:hypothetical protein CK203_038015 [Vitis vinifera]
MGVGCPIRKRSRRGCQMHINISLQRTEIGDLVVKGCPMNWEARCLEIPSSEEEVFSTLSDLNRDKSSGS